jgi:DNA-binding LacI/PurR family transcriptional regulator
MRSLSTRGIKVPADLSIVGFDNIELAEHIDPPITTIEQDFYGMGAEAARLLVARMNGKREVPVATTFLPTKLIIRASTTSPTEQIGKGGERFLES